MMVQEKPMAGKEKLFAVMNDSLLEVFNSNIYFETFITICSNKKQHNTWRHL